MKTHEKAQAIISELGIELFERVEHLRMLAVGMFGNGHVYMLGDPGTGKSLMARLWCQRIVGANYKELLLDKQLPMESLFGPIDIKAFEANGDWHRRTDGYLPWAHITFLDEVGKAGPAVLNPLLTYLNERIYHNNSVPMACPLLLAVGASNEELETELAAMWDRWLIRMMVEPIQEPGNFAALMATTTVAPPSGTPTVITLDEVTRARNVEVPAVTVPPGVVDTILQLRADLRGEQVKPSDRRWKQSMRLMQANAWLDGRSQVDEDDLVILRHVLWDVVEQVPAVERKVLALTSPITRAALEFAEMISDVEAGIEARRGQSVASRAEYGGEAQAKVTEISRRLTDLTEQAKRQGRSTDRLDAVASQVKALKVRVFVECLNVPLDRAEALGA